MQPLCSYPTVFPNLQYIWITRRNKVQQAVAMWNSFQRQVWRQDEPTSPKREAALHFEMIDRLAQRGRISIPRELRRYQNFVRPGKVVCRYHRDAAQPGRDGGPNALDGRRPFPSNVHYGPAKKVDAIARTAIDRQTHQSGASENQRWQDEPPLPAKKVKARLLK